MRGQYALLLALQLLVVRATALRASNPATIRAASINVGTSLLVPGVGFHQRMSRMITLAPR
jgi:hypothetical protein